MDIQKPEQNMKAIIISEAALELARVNLISRLTSSIEERERKIKSGEMTGMAFSAEGAVNYHVTDIFKAITSG